jgi:hypothetical protein
LKKAGRYSFELYIDDEMDIGVAVVCKPCCVSGLFKNVSNKIPGY